jgi:glycosyltransferase involved in cell wall biosynthesis
VRVLFVNLAADTDWGGGENWTLAAAAGLAQRGHAVRVAGRSGGSMETRARARGLDGASLPVAFDYAPATIAAAMRLLRRDRSEAVVVHHNKDVRTAGLAARLLGIAVVHRNGFPILKNTLRHRATYRIVDRILTNSERIRERYAAYGWIDPGRIDVVPNGIDPPKPMAAARHAMRMAWGVRTPDDLLAVYAGRLSGTKRVGDLLEGFAGLPQSSRWRLAVLGAGSRERELRGRAEQPDLRHRVHLLGHFDEAASLLVTADLVVLASSEEGMPNALMEAMAAGVPVAATPVGDVPDLLGDGSAGWLVPVGDPPAWTALLTRLEEDPQARSETAARGKARIEERYSFDAMIDGVERSLCAAIARNPAGTSGV